MIQRKRLVAGALLGGLAGVTAVGALRAAGPGDPPVIVLPSAKGMKLAPNVVPVQATATPTQKTEVLPPPSTLPLSVPLSAPSLIVPSQPLRVPPPAPTLAPKEPVRVAAARETAPPPRIIVAAKPLDVLPLPTATGPVPSRLAPPGESTMPLRSTAATAAALTAMLAAPAPAPAAPAQPPVIEKITDYAKADDVKNLKAEIESLRKDIAALTGKTGEAAKGTDLKSLHDDVASLKKEVANLSAVKPADTKGLKDDLDLLKKDVAALGTYLRESLDGKVDAKGFTHDGVAKRLVKLDEALDSLTKKMQAFDARLAESTRTAGSSPLTGTPPAAVPATRGTVRLVNEYPIEIAIAVNGISHRLEPNSRKDVPVAGGNFKYQLLTSGGAEAERSIKDNETVTLTIK